jgi:hypothetical protein
VTLSRSGLVRAATLLGTAALAMTAVGGFSAPQALALFAAAAAAVVPLSCMLGDGASARDRYCRNRRPLAGPKPGARLG